MLQLLQQHRMFSDEEVAAIPGEEAAAWHALKHLVNAAAAPPSTNVSPHNASSHSQALLQEHASSGAATSY
jgi:hypothetical protein